ncbi:site-specific DNA-methyltransferase [Croceicoccus bisphenolivorans]|uniref:site-specific DNA-methyltransferase n=1 Tax=Croceicoccus bisphenolivorans TaxID=1783232 RepID=UPI00082E8B3E|nr:DNA methyltransferase [Croceicoccus bisphenolivorans]
MAKTAPVRKRTRKPLDTTSLTAPDLTGSNDPHAALSLVVTNVAPGTLKPPPRILRTNGSRQMSAIRASIANFGFLNPILIDEENRIICGHARWLAAKDLGLVTVPVIRVDHLTDEQKRLYAIAENKTGALGEWNEDALRLEFGELLDLTLDLDVSVELSAFAMSEIDDLLVKDDGSDFGGGDAGRHAEITRPGDLWLLGDHRLYCGDALEESSYITLMGDDRAQMVFSDPPYNQKMKTISGKGKVQHEEFAMASGEMTDPEFTQFLTTAFGLTARFSQDGCIAFECIDWHNLRPMIDAGESVFSELKNLIVWSKPKGGQGGFYRSRHELIFPWKVGRAKHINNFRMGETGRYRTNVWEYAGNNTFHAGRDEELAAHPTVKPMKLVADAMRDCSHRGGIVLDCFGGAGTTLHAAEHTGRRARLIEIEPKFCDRTIERWQKTTKQEAVLAATGRSWREVAADRGVDLGDRSSDDRECTDDTDRDADPAGADDRDIVDVAVSGREDI